MIINNNKKIKKAKCKIKSIEKPKIIRKIKIISKSEVGSSNIENFFGMWVKKVLGFQLEAQYQIGRKYYDFKVKGKNILIEFDGSYFHGHPELFPKPNAMQKKAIKNDKFKDSLALANGYKLIRVWEKDFNENPEKVKQFLIEQIGSEKKL